VGQNEIYFAAKRVSFCGKTEPILRQNAGRFAAKWKRRVPETPCRSRFAEHKKTEAEPAPAVDLF